jgi:protein TonB
MTGRIFAFKALVVASLAAACVQSSQAHPATQAPPPTQTAVPDPDAPRRVGGSVLPPVLTKSVDPKYPRSYLGKPRPGGTVLVSIVVDRNGRPTETQIIRSGGDDLDKSALQAISHYRFEPATENGQAVPVKINVEVTFQLADKHRFGDQP